MKTLKGRNSLVVSITEESNMFSLHEKREREWGAAQRVHYYFLLVWRIANENRMLKKQ